jgi:hypothetical protein
MLLRGACRAPSVRIGKAITQRRIAYLFLSSHTSSQALGERTVCTMPARRACVRHPKGYPQPGL